MLKYLVLKDLKIELRSKEIVTSMFIFGVSVTLVFALGFQIAPNIILQFAPGLLWITILFTSVLGLNRLFSLEREDNALWSWLSAPIDRGTVYLSKLISCLIFVLLSEILLIIPFFIFLNLSTEFGLILLLGSTSILTIGCIISSITLQVGMRDVLIPILLFPLSTPIIIAAIKCTESLFSQKQFIEWNFWLLMLGTFSVIFGLFGYLIFSRIVED